MLVKVVLRVFVRLVLVSLFVRLILSLPFKQPWKVKLAFFLFLLLPLLLLPLLLSLGYEVTTMEDAATRASIFVTATGCMNILRSEHFMAMKDNSILANIGHFDIEVDVAWLETNAKKDTIKPQVKRGRMVKMVYFITSLG